MAFIIPKRIIIPIKRQHHHHQHYQQQQQAPPILFSFFAAQQQQQQEQQQQSLLANNNKLIKRYYVDGNNLIGQKGTPIHKDVIVHQLKQIQQISLSPIIEIILVFDGIKLQQSKEQQQDDEENKIIISNNNTKTTTTTIESSFSSSTGCFFQQVNLGIGLLADDYIQDEIKRQRQLLLAVRRDDDDNNNNNNDIDDGIGKQQVTIEVVTADRLLRKQVLQIKSPKMVQNVINPITFWKKYVPRLSGKKGYKSS